MSVPIQVAPTSLLSPPEAEWVTDDLFTYWQPYLPPGLSAATPLEGACFNGGQKLADTRTSELMEVSARDYVDVEGFNFVPSPHLSCVYHHVGGSGFSGVDDYQVRHRGGAPSSSLSRYALASDPFTSLPYLSWPFPPVSFFAGVPARYLCEVGCDPLPYPHHQVC